MKKENWIRRTLFQHHLVRDIDSYSPSATHIRRQILQEKTLLNKIYQEWYLQIILMLPKNDLLTLEIGSGASFLDHYRQDIISTDIMYYEGLDSVLDAQTLPFKNGSLNAIVMTNVFHHLNNPRSFLDEVTRCIRPGGKLIMIEPWVTNWSSFVYQNLHHEPFDPNSKDWEFPVDGPLSGANGALPWIIFHRDRPKFENDYPHLIIVRIKPMMPFIYLASGGITSREIIPGFFYDPIKFVEKLISPVNGKIAMFALIEIQRNYSVLST
jgi:SAM-dependent methyltransferase